MDCQLWEADACGCESKRITQWRWKLYTSRRACSHVQESAICAAIGHNTCAIVILYRGLQVRQVRTRGDRVVVGAAQRSWTPAPDSKLALATLYHTSARASNTRHHTPNNHAAATRILRLPAMYVARTCPARLVSAPPPAPDYLAPNTPSQYSAPMLTAPRRHRQPRRRRAGICPRRHRR